MGIFRGMSLSYIWHRVRHVFHSSETLCWLYYSECGRSLQSLERGYRNHTQALSLEPFPVCLPEFTPLSGAPVWREWDGYTTCSNLEFHPGRHLPRGPPEAAAPPRPMGRLSLQHQLPAHFLVVTYFPQGSRLQLWVGMGPQPKDSHGPEQKGFCFCFNLPSSLTWTITEDSKPILFYFFNSPGLLYTQTEGSFSNTSQTMTPRPLQNPPVPSPHIKSKILALCSLRSSHLVTLGGLLAAQHTASHLGPLRLAVPQTRSVESSAPHFLQ